jgi:hypothetical protein
MSKQPTQSQGTRRESAEDNPHANQSHDPKDRAKNPAAREHYEAQEGGGEESKHGRKQKGNVNDT